MSSEDFSRFDSLKLFMHQIYEYRKGVRPLVLCTMCNDCAQIMCKRLDEQGIPYIEQPVSNNKVNLYFGKKACLDVVRTFVHKPMHVLTPAEDFMLGAMLGYDITAQCERFCKRNEATCGQTYKADHQSYAVVWIYLFAQIIVKKSAFLSFYIYKMPQKKLFGLLPSKIKTTASNGRNLSKN